jgi:hypothetical protein
MPDALPDATLPISRLGTGSTNGSNNGRGWGQAGHLDGVFVGLLCINLSASLQTHKAEVGPNLGVKIVENVSLGQSILRVTQLAKLSTVYIQTYHSITVTTRLETH